MEKQVENTIQKVFVNVNQVWQKGEAISIDDKTFKIKAGNNPSFVMSKDSRNVEVQKNMEQQFAEADTKRRMEGAYISFEKLEPNIQESILEGKEQLIETTYINDGKLKESIKMVQMLYNSTYGSRLDVQIKRKELVKLKEANAYQYQFTKDEYQAMVNEGKTIQFTGTSLNGDSFQKLAYYEPKLNDIRTKSAVSANMYVLGQVLSKQQADNLNKGEEVKITIRKTQKGPLTYMVRWSAKGQRFLYKNLDKTNVKEKETKENVTVEGEKKKSQLNKAVSM
ncbi:hypothetical protein KCTC52924_03512 [Arenibacter antarcticus]|uniref:Uncharacterized protein n=1 Tax=Arenibacter antarcticus TaxID=2040469 RepID=A0ABW5VIK4_9FLAO|nr:hypothetical protein [Arenibacter sp. H213]MCM4166572.1 hypothetical protein [Arenibacter sp. H213]